MRRYEEHGTEPLEGTSQGDFSPPIENLVPAGGAVLGFGNGIAPSTGETQYNPYFGSPVSYRNDIVQASGMSPLPTGQSPPLGPFGEFEANQVFDNSGPSAVLKGTSQGGFPPPIENLFPDRGVVLGFGKDVAPSTGATQHLSFFDKPVSYWDDILPALDLDVPPMSPMHIDQRPPPSSPREFEVNQVFNNPSPSAVLNDQPDISPLAPSGNLDLETFGSSGPHVLGHPQEFPAATDDHLALTIAGPGHPTHLMVSPLFPLEPERTPATSGYKSRCHTNIGATSRSNVHNYILIRPKTIPEGAEMGLPSYGFDATSAHSAVQAGPSATSAMIDGRYPSQISTAAALRRTRRGHSDTVFAGCHKQRKNKPVKGVPENLCVTFEVRRMTGNVSSKEAPVKRGKRSSKVCLRCRDQHLKCSGGFPCSNCAMLLDSIVARRSRSTLYWNECVESDLNELNVFYLAASLRDEAGFYVPDDFLRILCHESTQIWVLALGYFVLSMERCGESWRYCVPLVIKFFIVTVVYREYLSRQLGISEAQSYTLASSYALIFFNRIGEVLSKLRNNTMTEEEIAELWSCLMLILLLIEKMEVEFFVLEGSESPPVYKELYEMKNHLRLYISHYIRKLPEMDMREPITALYRMAIGFDFSQGLLEPGPPGDRLGLDCWRRDQPSGPMNVGEHGNPAVG
ncbi:hypothetical protein RU639_009587 [Aspergillus parasiticus]